MGFLGMFNFDRPGRGVDPDAPEKRGLFLFFDILFRKFWKVCTLSLSYTLFSVPALIIYLFWNTFLQQMLSPIQDPAFITYIGVYLAMFFLCFLGAGPASAGAAYVLRNFSRESHSWVWEDLWTECKSNWKQGTALFILDIIIVTVLIFAAVLYLGSGDILPMPLMLSAVFGFFALVCLVLYFMMHFFLYPLMVTMDMRFGTLLKTALQLTMMKLPQSILVFILALGALAVFFALYYVNVGFVLLLIGFGFALVPFIGYFFGTSVMDAVLERQKREE